MPEQHAEPRPTDPSSPCDGPGLRAALNARESVLTLACGAGRSDGMLLAINRSYCGAPTTHEDETSTVDVCYLLGADASNTAAQRALDALALPASRLDRYLPSFNAWGMLSTSCWRCAKITATQPHRSRCAPRHRAVAFTAWRRFGRRLVGCPMFAQAPRGARHPLRPLSPSPGL